MRTVLVADRKIKNRKNPCDASGPTRGFYRTVAHGRKDWCVVLHGHSVAFDAAVPRPDNARMSKANEEPAAPASPAVPRPRRRWLQISLRTLLVVMALVAVAALAASWYEAPFRRQREAMAAIERAGGSYQASPAGPAWLRRLFGEDSFRNVTLVNVADCDEPAEYLDHVARLPALETLVVGGPDFTDEHVQRLHGLTTLTGLVLDCTVVTDDGIAALRDALGDLEVYRSQRRSIAALEKLGCALDKKPVASRLQLLVGGDWFEDTRSARVWNVAFGDADVALLKPLGSLYALSIPGMSIGNSNTRPKPPRKGEPRPRPSITDAGLVQLQGLEGLSVLHLDNQSGVTDAGMAHLRGLKSLLRLGLNGTLVGDVGLAHLRSLEKLQSLELQRTSVTDAGLAHLAGLGRLHNLFLNGTAVTDAGLEHLRGLPLESLLLDDTRVTDAGLAALAEQTGLWGLSLNRTAITDAGLAHIAGFKLLTSLQLSRTQIKGPGLRHLAALTKLWHMDLSDTSVDDAGLAHLRELRALQSLSLSGTRITDAGLANLKGLTKLSFVNLMAPGVTAEGEAELRRALPSCQVISSNSLRRKSR
jgi:hypothetical protein